MQTKNTAANCNSKLQQQTATANCNSKLQIKNVAANCKLKSKPNAANVIKTNTLKQRNRESIFQKLKK
ncbi:MAG: hypothetical protein RBQ94_06720 [Methanimicrococcus sp.]|nr:hypothetical protein [Methanimicrococcus sp.]